MYQGFHPLCFISSSGSFLMQWMAPDWLPNGLQSIRGAQFCPRKNVGSKRRSKFDVAVAWAKGCPLVNWILIFVFRTLVQSNMVSLENCCMLLSRFDRLMWGRCEAWKYLGWTPVESGKSTEKDSRKQTERISGHWLFVQWRIEDVKSCFLLWYSACTWENVERSFRIIIWSCNIHLNILNPFV